jgi:hypothetical protein
LHRERATTAVIVFAVSSYVKSTLAESVRAVPMASCAASVKSVTFAAVWVWLSAA